MASKELFLPYEKVRLSGKYNMIMDSLKVISVLKCSKEAYLDILNNYSKLKALYA